MQRHEYRGFPIFKKNDNNTNNTKIIKNKIYKTKILQRLL